MLSSVPDFIYYPLAFAWSIIYGSVAGVFFKLLAVYENWVSINRQEVLLWKKYPRRSYRKYVNSLWASQIRGRPVELAEYTRKQIEKAHPEEPFPIGRLALNTVFMLLIAPYMALRGVIDGPRYIYRRAVEMRKGQDPEKVISE